MSSGDLLEHPAGFGTLTWDRVPGGPLPGTPGYSLGAPSGPQRGERTLCLPTLSSAGCLVRWGFDRRQPFARDEYTGGGGADLCVRSAGHSSEKTVPMGRLKPWIGLLLALGIQRKTPFEGGRLWDAVFRLSTDACGKRRGGTQRASGPLDRQVENLSYDGPWAG